MHTHQNEQVQMHPIKSMQSSGSCETLALFGRVFGSLHLFANCVANLQIDVCHCSDFVRRFPNAFCQCSLPAIVGSLTFACSPVCFLALPCPVTLPCSLVLLPCLLRIALLALLTALLHVLCKQVQKCLFPLVENPAWFLHYSSGPCQHSEWH